jgi:hypothetical protein
MIDFSDPQQRKRYLTTPDAEQRLTRVADWQGHFTQAIEARLSGGNKP